MKRIVFLRHTKTAFNVEPIRLRGGLDVPLSREGFAQIPEVAERIKITLPNIRVVYSSPLARASILATAIAHEYELNVQKHDGLSSWNYGVLNGRSVSDVLGVLKTLSTGAGRELSPQGGESMNTFLKRLTGSIKDIITAAPEDGVVLVVTHLQNVMMGTHWLRVGLPENVSGMEYDYRETNELELGAWVELRRIWREP